MFTLQEIFEKVARHLLKQNKTATEINPINGVPYCRYKTCDGLQCAVGCLIDDEHYDVDMEGSSVDRSVAVKTALLKSGYPINYDTLRMLRHLQVIHDSAQERTWRECLIAAGIDHGLDVSFLDRPKKIISIS